MKLIKKYPSVGYGNAYYSGRKDGFKFEIRTARNRELYISANHKNGLRYNSQWDSITFDTMEQAHDFCENFLPNLTKYSTKN